jgi:hypothetical protein
LREVENESRGDSASDRWNKNSNERESDSAIDGWKNRLNERATVKAGGIVKV